MLQLLKYTPDMRDEVVRLLGNKKHKRLIWDWQFGQSPFGRPFRQVIAGHKGRIIGFNGVMPIDVIYAGTVIPGLWSCDFFVHRAHRGQGVGRRMKEKLIGQSQLILSLGISDQASALLLKMGWRESREVRVYAKVRTSDSLKDSALNRVQRISQMCHPTPGRDHVQVDITRHLPSAEQIDKLWARVGARYGKAVCRTGRYMHWRFGMHPLAEYQFLTLKENGHLVGIAALRESGSTLHLVDYVGVLERPPVLAALLIAMERCFPRAHREVCTTSSPELQAALRGCGFLRTRAKPRFYVRSSLESHRNCEAGWFIMSGDSDGELLDAARAGVRQCQRQQAKVE